jgi:hypothetical protein
MVPIPTPQQAWRHRLKETDWGFVSPESTPGATPQLPATPQKTAEEAKVSTCIHLLYTHSSKILQETLLHSVSNELLPCRVGKSYDSFTLLIVKDVMLFQHCQKAIQVL